MTDRPLQGYWRRKGILRGPIPRFPVRWWWEADELTDVEQVYFRAVQDAGALLDVGAGDLRVRKKWLAAGFRGRYDTQDVGDEYRYTYAALNEVQGSYAAILCLDVLEHLTLDDGLVLLDQLVALLQPGGVLVVQTPNARCVRYPLGWDMTHRHCYNLTDLWAHLTAAGLDVEGYRIVLVPRRRGLRWRARFVLRAFLTAWVLGADYADNIAVVARKPAVHP